MENDTYSLEEVENIVEHMRARQETLEALECAIIIMNETKQYPRFINRLKFMLSQVQGIVQEEKESHPVDKDLKDEIKVPEKTITVKTKQ
jgi:hypothetical protein